MRGSFAAIGRMRASGVAERELADAFDVEGVGVADEQVVGAELVVLGEPTRIEPAAEAAVALEGDPVVRGGVGRTRELADPYAAVAAELEPAERRKTIIE